MCFHYFHKCTIDRKSAPKSPAVDGAGKHNVASCWVEIEVAVVYVFYAPVSNIAAYTNCGVSAGARGQCSGRRHRGGGVFGWRLWFEAAPPQHVGIVQLSHVRVHL